MEAEAKRLEARSVPFGTITSRNAVLTSWVLQDPSGNDFFVATVVSNMSNTRS